MAQIITVSLYSIRVTLRGKDNPLHLDKFDGATDLFDVIKNAFSELEGKAEGLDDEFRRLTLPKPITIEATDRILHGLVEVGGYGYGSSLRDIKSGKESYKRKPTDAEMVPLFVRIWIPKGQQFGIMALQNFGETGCKTLLTNLFLKHWDAVAENHMLRFREIVPPAIYEELISKRQVTKIRFIHHGIPQDIADAYGGNSLDPRRGEVEIVVSALKNSDMGAANMLRKAFKRDTFSSKDVFEYDNFEPHEMKVELRDEKGRKQTISFADMIRAHSRVNVSDRVTATLDGHPTPDSIDKVCRSLMMNAAKDLN